MASIRLKKPVELVRNTIVKRDWISLMEMLTIKDLQEKINRYDPLAKVKIDPDGQLEISWVEYETIEQFKKRKIEYEEAERLYELQKKKTEVKRKETLNSLKKVIEPVKWAYKEAANYEEIDDHF